MVALEDIDLFWGVFEKFAFYKSVGGKTAKVETSDSSQKEVVPFSPACLAIENSLPGNALKARTPRDPEGRALQQRPELPSEHIGQEAPSLRPERYR